MSDIYGRCNHCGENLTAGHTCSGMLRNLAFFEDHSVKLRPSYEAIEARLAEAERDAARMRKFIDERHACECHNFTGWTCPRCEAIGTADSAPAVPGTMPLVVDDLDSGGRERLAAKGLTLGSAPADRKDSGRLTETVKPGSASGGQK